PTTAERRQLSVMFRDLVGSTELSSRLDPEDLGALIRAYQGRAAGTIARFDGFIAKYMGRRNPRLFRLAQGWRDGRGASGPRRAGRD
ncbi:MAG: hypothetical protein WBQ75_08180, partial [Acetobacteraceae bacterium]